MTFEQIRDDACRRAGITVADFYNGRQKPRVWARKVVAHKMRSEGWSLEKIGVLINRHHATVVHMLKTPPAYYRSKRKLIKCAGT